MGLDIHISADNYEKIYSPDYYDEKYGYYHKHSLSRTFCDLILRHHVIDHEPELEQIGKISGVDISPLCDMENYPEEEELSFFLGVAGSEEERSVILKKAEEDKTKLNGNIDKVTNTITGLIEKLNSIPNLPELLLPAGFETLDNEWYFGDFQVDKGDGYIGNNFGQDLRNFKRLLEFAKVRGTTTVWFHFG